MKIIILAFIISISLHFFLFNSYKVEKINKKEEIKEVKTDIKFVKLKKEEITIIPKPIEQKVEQKVEQKIQQKVESNKIKNEISKSNVGIPKKIEIDKSKDFQKKILNEQSIEKQESLQDKTLENFLSQKEPINKEILNELERLYGEEYKTFTKIQKAYLEKNLNNFQIITQKVLNRLGYPPLAAKLRIGGVNIVEFMFHPDGSITELKIIDSSGYSILDKYSLELIEIAYKDYPKPQTTTKLRFNVIYRSH